MKHIFIIGSRGYHAKYGGWETFVSNLVDNYNDSNTIFHISEVNDSKNQEYKINNNIIVNSFCIKVNGGLKMLLCTMKSFNYYLKYIKKNKIENACIYVLGLKLGPLLNLRRKSIKKLGITTLVNPDGLEHERSKWNKLVKKYFLLSEKWMLHSCDKIICDAKGIKEYLDNKYTTLKNKTIYIAYGASYEDFNDLEENDTLQEYNLQKDNYLLMVGRFVPENNYELIINDFMKSNIKKDLVIISNISSGTYYQKIIETTNCLSDQRIKFIDGVYDSKKLAIIRKNAYLYIHGHSVGGTNPSLLEALSLTDLNILYDVNFNFDIGKEACLYFKEKGSLTKLLDNQKYLDNQKRILGIKAKKIIKDNFTWDIIVSKYKKIFK